MHKGVLAWPLWLFFLIVVHGRVLVLWFLMSFFLFLFSFAL